jgi:RNA 2',3'-cyclic 3'-phosphodiesterase
VALARHSARKYHWRTHRRRQAPSEKATDRQAAVTTTHQSALVLVPPSEVWEPIQAIRRAHDRQFRRWMPHVTLLYPFLPRDALAHAAPAAREALADVAAFEIVLARFDAFRHRGTTFTLRLAPEPKEALAALHAALVRRFPECDATGRFAGGFTPHLSVGQARDEEQLRALRREVDAWTPLRFVTRHVTIIVRELPPHDVFRTFAEVPLGAGAGPALP